MRFSNKKEQNTNTYYSMNEPQNHYPKWKKPHTKKQVSVLFDSVYMRCPEKANLWRQRVHRWLPGLGVKAGLSADRLKGIFWRDENGLEPLYGDDGQLYKFILKITEFYIINGRSLWYVKYTLIKLREKEVSVFSSVKMDTHNTVCASNRALHRSSFAQGWTESVNQCRHHHHCHLYAESDHLSSRPSCWAGQQKIPPKSVEVGKIRHAQSNFGWCFLALLCLSLITSSCFLPISLHSHVNTTPYFAEDRMSMKGTPLKICLHRQGSYHRFFLPQCQNCDASFSWATLASLLWIKFFEMLRDLITIPSLINKAKQKYLPIQNSFAVSIYPFLS